MRALVVDRYELFRFSLRSLLERGGRFDPVEEVSSAAAFIRTASRGVPAALAVIHPRSIGLDEEDCIRLAQRIMPAGALLVFDDNSLPPKPVDNQPHVLRLPRTASCREVERALSDLQAQIAFRRPETDGAIAGHQPLAVRSTATATQLSNRQREILEMVAEGLANKEIGHRLGIAEGTVKAHIHAIFRALGVSNRTQAVVQYSSSLRETSTDSSVAIDQAEAS